MERSEFEYLRDLPGKVISGDVRFRQQRNASPLIRAEDLPIRNASGVELLLDITYNPVRGSKSFNVTLAGTGPVCRLDVDGPPHRPAGGSHKHSLQTPRCPDRNLPDAVVDRSDLSGRSVRELFDEFCRMAGIEFVGTFESPDGGGQHAER